MKTTKRHKYGAKKTTTDGITFDSKKEAEYYGLLKIRKMSGNISDFELQPKFIYKMTCFNPDGFNSRIFTKTYKYIADFKVFYPEGEIEIIDVKGMQTSEFKRKKKIVEKIYGIEIKIV